MNPRIDLGVWLSDGGERWPELRAQLLRIFSERVAGLPWVPRDWLARINALAAANPTKMVRIGPAMIGPATSPEAPAFAVNPAMITAWQEIFRASESAVNAYSRGELQKGLAELASFNRAAAFWNGAYAITKAIADAPSVLVGRTLDGAGSFTAGILKRLASSWLVWAAAIGVGGFFMWKAGLLKLKRKGKA